MLSVRSCRKVYILLLTKRVLGSADAERVYTVLVRESMRACYSIPQSVLRRAIFIKGCPLVSVVAQMFGEVMRQWPVLLWSLGTYCMHSERVPGRTISAYRSPQV